MQAELLMVGCTASQHVRLLWWSQDMEACVVTAKLYTVLQQGVNVVTASCTRRLGQVAHAVYSCVHCHSRSERNKTRWEGWLTCMVSGGQVSFPLYTSGTQFC